MVKIGRMKREAVLLKNEEINTLGFRFVGYTCFVAKRAQALKGFLNCLKRE